MAISNIQSNTEQKQELKSMGLHMTPNIELTYRQIIDNLIAEYKEKHGIAA